MVRTDPDNANVASARILCESADAPRGQIGAAKYKHVTLDLLLQECVSDSFDTYRDGFNDELAELDVCPGECERPMAVARERSKGVADAG